LTTVQKLLHYYRFDRVTVKYRPSPFMDHIHFNQVVCARI